MQKEYVSRNPLLSNEDAAIIGAYIDVRLGGRATPEAMVSNAADPQSPLHRYFEWDDKKCGRLYRLTQARHLIASVLVQSDDNIPMRQYLNVKIGADSTYTSIEQIEATPDLIEQVIEDAYSQLIRWKTRYGRYCSHFNIQQSEDMTKITIEMKGKVHEKEKRNDDARREKDSDPRSQRKISAINNRRDIAASGT